MSFRRSAPAILITAAIIVVAAVAGISNLLTGRMLANAEADSFRLMRDVLASITKSTEEKALVRAEIVSSMPAVRAAFVNRDRAKLLEECRPMFEEQSQKYGLDQAQFHLPPGTSFLRLHSPGVFGDDQSSYRPMLVEVNTEKAPRKGIVVTRAGPAVSGIVPVADDSGKHVGSFEMGLELAPMFDKIKAAYTLEGAVYINEKMLRELATDLTGDVLAEKNRVGKFIRFYATHTDLMRALVTDRDVEVTDPVSYSRTVAGAPWGVQLVPLYNYTNKQIGVIAVADDFSETRAEEGRTRIWLLLSALFGIVLLSGAILIVIRGILLAPLAVLNERMSALLRGEPAAPTDPMPSYCEELQTLAQNYEQLRSEKQS